MTNETKEILKAIKKEIDAEIEQCQYGIDNFKGGDIFIPHSFVKKRVRK